MADVFTSELRSKIMARIRKKESRPERIVRTSLFNRGLRFRKNVEKLPGCPDIVLKKYSTIIFVNGCFWHAHANCKLNKPPKTNTNYWLPKIKKNVERDKDNKKLLIKLKWKVITVWECQLLGKNSNMVLKNLYQKIINKK